MSSSNIIKACDGLAYDGFDFRDLVRVPCAGPKAAHPDATVGTNASNRPAQTPDEAVARLQEELQERLVELDRRAQEVEREAAARGFVEGREEGIRQGKEEAAASARRLEALIEEFSGLRTRVLQDYRQWLLASSLEIAKQVVQRELETRPELLLDTMEGLLTEADERYPLTFFLHPEDLRLLREQVDLTRLHSGANAICLQEDETLTRGGCRLESEVQSLDGSLETRFQLIHEEISKKAERWDAEPDAAQS